VRDALSGGCLLRCVTGECHYRQSLRPPMPTARCAGSNRATAAPSGIPARSVRRLRARAVLSSSSEKSDSRRAHSNHRGTRLRPDATHRGWHQRHDDIRETIRRHRGLVIGGLVLGLGLGGFDRPASLSCKGFGTLRICQSWPTLWLQNDILSDRTRAGRPDPATKHSSALKLAGPGGSQIRTSTLGSSSS
jgi:hypothetical protein